MATVNFFSDFATAAYQAANLSTDPWQIVVFTNANAPVVGDSYAQLLAKNIDTGFTSGNVTKSGALVGNDKYRMTVTDHVVTVSADVTFRSWAIVSTGGAVDYAVCWASEASDQTVTNGNDATFDFDGVNGLFTTDYPTSN